MSKASFLAGKTVTPDDFARRDQCSATRRFVADLMAGRGLTVLPVLASVTADDEDEISARLIPATI